ncbi:hypothetical protein SAMN03159444_05219, partial [Pseudomonas sp. NFACC02]
APIPNRAPFSAWRPLARLEVELVAAVGAGYSGNLMLSMKDGRFLLSIKAGLIVGAGIKGYMTFEVGYESVIALAELVRKEMAANRYKDLEWVDGEALAYLRDLSFLGATGIDVAFAYIRGYSMVKAVYDALNDGGRGGLIAYALMEDKNYHVMNDWVVNLQPQAFGPLLLALSSPPKAFSVAATEGKKDQDFEVDDAHFLQQKAIERCIGWISQKPDAAQQFEEALICMNRDGVRPEQAGYQYCRNRLHLDLFMSERVKALFGDSDRVREQYRVSVYKLGGRLDNFCQHRMLYRGSPVPSTRQFKTEYKGPYLD